WPLPVAVAVVAELGLAVGGYLARSSHPGTAAPVPTPSASASSRTPVSTLAYRVPATVRLDKSGNATVTWPPDAAALPGFEEYFVFQVDNPRPVATGLGAYATSYPVGTLRRGQRACYFVIAYGVTAPPPSTQPGPACASPPA